jgi:hypothetical protein
VARDRRIREWRGRLIVRIERQIVSDIPCRDAAFDLDVVEVLAERSSIAKVDRAYVAACIGHGFAPCVMRIERKPLGESLLERSLPGVEIGLLRVIQIRPLDVVWIGTNTCHTIDGIERSRQIELHPA